MVVASLAALFFSSMSFFIAATEPLAAEVLLLAVDSEVVLPESLPKGADSVTIRQTERN